MGLLSSVVRREPEFDFDRSKLMVFGHPGVGKSTFFASFPDALILGCDPGDGWAALSGHVLTVDSREKLFAAIEEIDLQEHNFKWVVVDTVNAVWRYLEASYLDGYNKKGERNDRNWEGEQLSVSGIPFGKGTDAVKSDFVRVITKLMNVCQRRGMGLALAGHALRVVVRKHGQGEGHHVNVCGALNDKAWLELQGLLDIVGYLTNGSDPETGQPAVVMHTRKTAMYDAKDRSGKLPGTVVIPEGAAYDAVARFFPKYVRHGEQPVAPAEPADMPDDDTLLTMPLAELRALRTKWEAEGFKGSISYRRLCEVGKRRAAEAPAPPAIVETPAPEPEAPAPAKRTRKPKAAPEPVVHEAAEPSEPAEPDAVPTEAQMEEMPLMDLSGLMHGWIKKGYGGSRAVQTARRIGRSRQEATSTAPVA